MGKRKRFNNRKHAQPAAVSLPQGKSAYWLVLLRCFLCWAAIGFCLPWLGGGFSLVKGKLFPKENTAAQASVQTEPETPETAEAEFERLEKFLEKIAPLERAAEDWYFANSPAAVSFLGRDVLPRRAEDALGCSVSGIGPDEDFFVCSEEFFSFYDFYCDKSGCGWLLCRKDVSDGCLYSVRGSWPGSGRWDYSARVEAEARKLGKTLYERKGWRITAW